MYVSGNFGEVFDNWNKGRRAVIFKEVLDTQQITVATFESQCRKGPAMACPMACSRFD